MATALVAIITNMTHPPSAIIRGNIQILISASALSEKTKIQGMLGLGELGWRDIALRCPGTAQRAVPTSNPSSQPLP
jgi:hypothetical protein